MKNKNQRNDVDVTNPIRETLKDRIPVDFVKSVALVDVWRYCIKNVMNDFNSVLKPLKKIKIEPHTE